MNIKSVLKELGNQVGIHELKLDNNGACRLVFDEKMIVDIESDELSENVRFYSVVAMLASEPSVSIYEKLLSANLSGLSGGANYFGIDSAAREIVLFSNLDMESIDHTRFSKRLEVFVNDLEHWVEKYQRGGLNEEEIEINADTSEVQGIMRGYDPTPGLRL